MASIKTRKRFMYAIFSCVFLLGGIEYAVILPTLWLYLHNTYDAPGYMLGVVLSAYSLAAFFSSPIIGRIVDKTRRTKAVFITCACFQMAGSFLYFVGFSQWLCVASRFICGIGGAGEAVALAEVSRYTSEQERTGIISKLVSIRQIALVAAPGLNLILRLLHFKIGPFVVNEYTVPGAFMTALWLVFLVLVVVLYSEPQDIYDQENKTLESSGMNADKQLSNETSGDLYDDVKISHDQSRGVQQNGFDNNGVLSTRNELSSSPNLKIYHNDNQPKSEIATPTSNLLESYEVMASAERFICSSELNNHEEAVQHCQILDAGPADSWSLMDDEQTPFLPDTSNERLDSDVCPNSANDNYIKNHISHIDDVIVREGKFGFFCKEYIKDNVMAILTLLFCVMFTQIALEAMCTQISLEYLDFGELENSLLYCVCGAEIVVVFFIVSVMSKYVADRNMIIFGGVLLLASNICLLLILPNAPKHDRSHNLLPMAIAIVVDVLSLPFLFVCSTSLYSKMTRRETQGLSQGLRRAIVGLGTIMAPLWASSVVSRPYLVLGVLIGVQSLAMSMCLMSYKRLKGLEQETPISQPPTPKPTDHSAVTRPTTTSAYQSTQYGSIDSTDSFVSQYPAVRSHETV